ncbi:MAG: polyprenyl synthetase family protein [Syntrophales bacterium]|jgi:geranylgeranyl diphosphate synthase type II|nr:polyprenyl synthetase family protein [Syntrophales bacterium]MDY0043381.1 polyprenyl synthetase family protein [Syntrophales bacterium]
MNSSGEYFLKTYLDERKNYINEALEHYLPQADTYPSVLSRAVRYSVFAGGKRLRPILCIAAAEAVGGTKEKVCAVACALEMIHTYSLIHDDLPAMDDDEYRRGILTNHKVFGEGIAILAGDALLTEAFSLMSEFNSKEKESAVLRLGVIHEIAKAAGIYGMVGGQTVDLDSEGREVDFETLQYIHTHKTEAMITASLRAGAITAEGSKLQISEITEYGKKIGLAFQIIDDILDLEGNSKTLGKKTGCDGARKKITYPSHAGLEFSRTKAHELVKSARADLASFDNRADPLRMIASYIVERVS